ncbi:divalent-cation tolerance protein CutA [Maricaulis sp.]|uniref:divalent-cation tolerance protein CutA n=1 Tax=Maricaulis sp. TaxID=1486257 RepID=UPI00261DBB60|nr:divalent-cation tolerance protein CutA [Maricaulis sp.]
MPAYHWIYTTWPDAESAAVAARTLVGDGLCACANIQPEMTSLYVWEGEVQEERETVMILKASASSLAPLRQRFLTLHPYDVPCFAVLDIQADGSHQPYLEWLAAKAPKPM